MSDTPKFTVVDRRKFRAEEEDSSSKETSQSEPKGSAGSAVNDSGEKAGQVGQAGLAGQAGSRLTLVEPSGQAAQKTEDSSVAVAEMPPARLEVVGAPESSSEENGEEAEAGEVDLPPMPSLEEIRFQKAAYEKAAERLEDLVRAQNPGAPGAETIGFEHLVQQLYLSAMMQMGAGTPEGQRPRIDILGARQTIELLGVVLDKTSGNLSTSENRTLETVLFELRMTFLELTRMISAPQPPMPPPPGAKR